MTSDDTNVVYDMNVKAFYFCFNHIFSPHAVADHQPQSPFTLCETCQASTLQALLHYALSLNQNHLVPWHANHQLRSNVQLVRISGK